MSNLCVEHLTPSILLLSFEVWGLRTYFARFFCCLIVGSPDASVVLPSMAIGTCTKSSPENRKSNSTAIRH